MVLSSWRSVIARVHPVHLINADSAPGGRQPSAKPIDLGCESAGSCYHPYPPSPFYYYSAQRLILILPSHGG